MDERSFLRTRAQEALLTFSHRWEGFRAAQRRRDPSLGDEVSALARDYELLAAAVYRVRARVPASDPFRLRLEDAFGSASQDLSTLGLEKPLPKGELTRRYRAVWRENLPLFVLSVVLFVGSCIIGHQLVTKDPAFAPVLIPQGIQEQVLDHDRWFDDLKKNPFVGGVQIALNNVKVCLTTFALGALFGVGAWLMLGYNGLLFGAIFGFCLNNGFDEALLDFVVGHGPLELSIIVASAFSGFLVGRVFYLRPYSLFGRRIAAAARDAGCVVSGVTPWLCLAGFIEAFVSPLTFIPVEIKVTLGLVAAVAFWGWTFWPSDSTRLP